MCIKTVCVWSINKRWTGRKNLEDKINSGQLWRTLQLHVLPFQFLTRPMFPII